MITKRKTKKEWDNILGEFENYEGSIEEFCQLKKISRSCLYKHRSNRLSNNYVNETEPEISFTKINIKEDLNKACSNNHIVKIEIGKARIVLDSADQRTLSFLMKELSSIC